MKYRTVVLTKKRSRTVNRSGGRRKALKSPISAVKERQPKTQRFELQSNLENLSIEALEQLESWLKTLGLDQRDPLSVIHIRLGDAYKKCGNLEKSEQHYAEALKMELALRGPHAVEGLRLRFNLVGIYLRKGEISRCVDQFQMLHHGYMSTLGAEHPSTLEVLNLLAEVWYQLEQYDTAFELWEKALRGKDATCGIYSEDSGRICECLIKAALKGNSDMLSYKDAAVMLPYASRLLAILTHRKSGTLGKRSALDASKQLIKCLQEMRQNSACNSEWVNDFLEMQSLFDLDDGQ